MLANKRFELGKQPKKLVILYRIDSCKLTIEVPSAVETSPVILLNVQGVMTPEMMAADDTEGTNAEPFYMEREDRIRLIISTRSRTGAFRARKNSRLS